MSYAADLKTMSTIDLLLEQENLLLRAQEVLDELHRRDYLLWERLVRLVFPDVDPSDVAEEITSDTLLETLLEKLEQGKGSQDGPNHSS